MDKAKFVENHIIDCIRAAIVEANGEEVRATRLRAQAKLRLICMTDEEIWELARRTSFPPNRTTEAAYHDIRETIEEYKAKAEDWLPYTFGPVPAYPNH